MSQDITVTEEGKEQIYTGEAPREMIEAGVFYGRKKSKTNPKMKPFIFGTRGGIEVINLQKTSEMLEKAMAFIKEKSKNEKNLILFVGTEPAAEAALLETAKEFNMPHVTLRWVGGTITNFSIISKRLDHLKKTRTDLASGALDKYTKKERVEMDKEVKRLEELMGGLEDLSREPDFLVIINPVLHSAAVREALKKKIPIVALANVDADPDEIDYLVPGNDKAKTSITWFLKNVQKAIREGIAMRNVPSTETPVISLDKK